jgi:hypothetical protein
VLFRSRLSKIVSSIETEFSLAEPAALAPNIRPTVQPIPAQPASREPDWSIRPEVHARQTTAPQIQPQSYDPAAEPDKVEERRSRRASSALFKRLAGIFVFVTCLALIVMLGWALWSSSLFNNAENSDDGPTKITQSESSSSQGAAQVGNASDTEEKWITVFEPKDAASVEVSDGLSAELTGTGRNAHLKIIGSKDAKNSEANFEIGRGVLENLRGKKIVFNVQANTTDGATTQMAVSCSLAGMGECSRVRFRLDGQRTENLIIVQLSDNAPEASGTLTIVPDIDKSGNPVEIVAIRVRAEQ